MTDTATRRRIDGQAAVRRIAGAEFRALGDEGSGAFEALVSAYGTTYDIGWGWQERIERGAFASAEGESVPIMYQHQWGMAPIGDGIASETDLGLIIRGQLYLDEDPFVARIYRAMKAKALREWSVGFCPEAMEWTDDEPEVDIITLATLLEASVVLRGANPDTATLDLRNRKLWIVGNGEAEVVRLRSAVPTLEAPAAETAATPAEDTEARADDDDDEADEKVSAALVAAQQALADLQAAIADASAAQAEDEAADDEDDDEESTSDRAAPDETIRRRTSEELWALMETEAGRALVAELRSSSKPTSQTTATAEGPEEDTPR